MSIKIVAVDANRDRKTNGSLNFDESLASSQGTFTYNNNAVEGIESDPDTGLDVSYWDVTRQTTFT